MNIKTRIDLTYTSELEYLIHRLTQLKQWSFDQ